MPRTAAVRKTTKPNADLALTQAVASRFTKLDANGNALPDSAKEWAAVHEGTHANGDPRRVPLIWDADGHGRFTAAEEAAFLKTHQVAGGKAESPKVVDLFELAPRNEVEEAEYAKFFRGAHGYYRAAEQYAPSPGCRWGVGFGGGASGDLYDGGGYFVRAVRASQ